MFIRHIDVTTNHKTSFEYDNQSESITVTVDGQTEVIELTGFPLHAKFEGIETELAMNVLHDVERTEEGLFVTLLNAVPKAPAYYDTDWKEVDEDGELRRIRTDTTEESSPDWKTREQIKQEEQQREQERIEREERQAKEAQLVEKVEVLERENLELKLALAESEEARLMDSMESKLAIVELAEMMV